MSEPANSNDQPPPPESEREESSRADRARPSDDDGPHAGASLDLPMSSPD
jgi:hypothetical protein